jgi:PIN domain nuclease of toxin-antitoxin system
MKLLLDTHTFIWWDSEPEKLSENALSMLEDASNTLMLRVVSIWEMQIKIQAGKLTIDNPLQQIIEHQQNANALLILPVETAHIYTLGDLSLHHKDPFDRLLIAQAIAEDMVIVTADKAFKAYPVKLAE